MSKLAFVPIPDRPAGQDFWRLSPGKGPAMNWEKRIGGIPCECADASQYRYWLRVFMDHISLKLGLLPLHAAVVGRRDSVLFIVAPAGGGKSLLARELTLPPAGHELICDDHCYIGKEHIQGNSLCRLRGPDGEQFCKALAEKRYRHGKSSLVLSAFGENLLEQLSGGALASEAFCMHALKYVMETPRAFPASLENVFGPSIKNAAMSRLANFLAGLDACYRLSGKSEFMASKLSTILAHAG